MLGITLDGMSKPTFRGMTVNERLFTARLLGQWMQRSKRASVRTRSLCSSRLR